MICHLKPRVKGILIALFGVLCVSPDAVLIRFLSTRETNPWTIVFWKMLLSVFLSASYAVYEAGGLTQLWHSMVEGKWYYAAAIPVQAAVDICFTMSFVYNSAANALLLINLNPLWCALLGRLFLGDDLPKHTILALAAALGCILIIFVPPIVVGDDAHEEAASSSLRGNLISFFTGIFLATYITIVRKGGQDSTKNINLIGAAALGALVSALIAFGVRLGDVLPNDYWRTPPAELWQFWLPMAAEGLMIGTIFITLSIAPKLAKGAEVALVLLLEVVLGPLWVFLAYGDAPPIWTLVGGSLLLTVLALHESRPLFQKAHQRLSSRLSSGGKDNSQLLKTATLEVTSSSYRMSEQAAVDVPQLTGEEEGIEAPARDNVGPVHITTIMTGIADSV